MSSASDNKVSKNPPPLQPGMDNPWYDYSPYPKRAHLNWPRNARVACEKSWRQRRCAG